MHISWLIVLFCLFSGLMGTLTFFFPVELSVFCFRMRILINFLDRENYLRAYSEKYGQELIDDPRGYIKKYYEEHLAPVILTKIMAILYWILFLLALQELIRRIRLV